MKKAILTCVITVPLLVGCEVFPKNSTPTLIPPAVTTRIVIDPKLLQECESLPLLPEPVTYEVIAEHYINTIGAYGVCAAKQRASISTIKTLANLDKSQ